MGAVVVVIDASVAVLWLVEQPGSEQAAEWLRKFADDPDLFVAPDLLRFEVHGALARLQPKRNSRWAAECWDLFQRIAIPLHPTTDELFLRAIELSRELRIGGYDAVYLAHAEALRVPWLTADARILRQLARDRRLRAL